MLLIVLLAFFSGIASTVNAVAGGIDVRASSDKMSENLKKNNLHSRLVISGGLSFNDALYAYDSLEKHSDLLTTVIKPRKKIYLFSLLPYLAGDDRVMSSDSEILLSCTSDFAAEVTKEDLAQYEAIVTTRTNITLEELRRRMASPEPITAEQAVEYGFAHKIVD